MFWSYGQKSSQSIILQDYVIRYISGWNQLISWIVCIWTDYQKSKTPNLIFPIKWPGISRYLQSSTCTQRLSESNSFTRHVSQSRHTFLVNRLSQQFYLSNQIVGFIDQTDVQKKSLTSSVSLHIGRFFKFYKTPKLEANDAKQQNSLQINLFEFMDVFIIRFFWKSFFLRQLWPSVSEKAFLRKLC